MIWIAAGVLAASPIGQLTHSVAGAVLAFAFVQAAGLAHLVRSRRADA